MAPIGALDVWRCDAQILIPSGLVAKRIRNVRLNLGALLSEPWQRLLVGFNEFGVLHSKNSVTQGRNGQTKISLPLLLGSTYGVFSGLPVTAALPLNGKAVVYERTEQSSKENLGYRIKRLVHGLM